MKKSIPTDKTDFLTVQPNISSTYILLKRGSMRIELNQADIARIKRALIPWHTPCTPAQIERATGRTWMK